MEHQPAPRSRHVAVIGAGPAGIGTAKCLLEAGHTVTVFEKSDGIGGIWDFRPERSGGVYDATVYQTSKFISCFSDYPMSASTSMFPTHGEFKAYLDAYAAAFLPADCVRLDTAVERVARGPDGWRVTVASGGAAATHDFDEIAVCTGSYWEPDVPEIPGRRAFTGVVLHAADYKTAGLFEGKRVVVVGSGVSGMDIAVEASRLAARVHWSARTRNWIKPRWLGGLPYESGIVQANDMSREDVLAHWRKWIPEHHAQFQASGLIPDKPPFGEGFGANDEILSCLGRGSVERRPGLARFTPTGCEFDDGSHCEADIVVLATGYQSARFPFLEPEMERRLGRHDEGMDLYQHMFHPEIPGCAFIFQVSGNSPALPTIELQARWFARILDGSKQLPEPGAMRAWIADEVKLRKATLNSNGFRSGFIDSAYLVRLAELAGVLPDKLQDLDAYVELVRPPSFPAIFRVVGPLPWAGARAALEQARNDYPLKAAHFGEPRRQILRAFPPRDILQLLKARQIGMEEALDLLAERLALTDGDGALPAPARGLVAQAEADHGQAAPAPDAGAAALASRLRPLLVAQVCELLNFDAGDIDPEEELNAYGFDSISLSQLVQRLRDTLRIEIGPEALFEHGSVARLAQHLALEYGAQVNAYLHPEATAPQAPAVAAVAAIGGEAAPYSAAQLRRLQQVLIDQVCGLLNFDAGDIDAQEELTAYGFDSISLSQLVQTIRDEFSIEIGPEALFEHASVARLASHLLDAYGAAMQRYLAAPAPAAVAGLAAVASPAALVAPVAPVAPSAAQRVQEILVGKVCGLLNFDAEDIDPDEELSVYGFDSISLSQLVQVLRDEFQIEIGPEALFEHATLALLSAYLVETFAAQIDAHLAADAEGAAESGSMPPQLWERQAPASIIAIRGEGGKRPFFGVHPISGSISYLTSLAPHFSADQPVYALPAVGYNGEASPLNSIEDMARHHIREIRAIQPCGPYTLGGWSFGGIVAHEMAFQLECAGEEVAHVVLIDAYLHDGAEYLSGLAEGPFFWRTMRELVKQWKLKTPPDLDAAERETAGLGLPQLLAHAIGIGMLPPDVDEPRIRSILAVFRGNCAAYEQFAPHCIQAPMSVISANDFSMIGSPEQARLWEARSKGRVDADSVEGDHYSIFTSHRLKALGQAVNRALARGVREQVY